MAHTSRRLSHGGEHRCSACGKVLQTFALIDRPRDVGVIECRDHPDFPVLALKRSEVYALNYVQRADVLAELRVFPMDYLARYYPGVTRAEIVRAEARRQRWGFPRDVPRPTSFNPLFEARR